MSATGIAVGVSLCALIGALPAMVATASSAGAAVHAFGSTPYQAILDAADASKDCGLSRNELAAIMMAPIFPEAGGSASTAPSPMTLSRWDTNSALWFQGNKYTPYQKTFWHPGVGLWQFDSAGGWNLTAADAINTATAAPVAAATMVSRYCASSAATEAGRRTYAWGPWYGCGSTTCENNFQDLYNSGSDSIRSENLPLTATVGTKGGMVTRSCKLNGTITVTCYYIDPGAAQGNKSWAVEPTNGTPPTPISAPFYDISYNGREWRVWLPEDHQYTGETISADKPITANARTSLVWSTTTSLCDMTANRGACGRVATTPWGNFTSNPFGSIDAATGGIAQLTVSGWVIDPDTNDSVTVGVVAGSHEKQVVANISRPDVASAVPGYGQNHGFEVTLDNLASGQTTVCVYAYNIGPYGDGSTWLGDCKTVTVDPVPPGPFPDVGWFHQFREEIQWLVDDGITTGYSDGNFRPDSYVSRGAMAMFLWRAAGEPAAAPDAPTFYDVNPNDANGPAIAWLAGAGITTGYPDGHFGTQEQISRQAMAAFLYRYAGSPRGLDPQCSSSPFTDVLTTNAFCGEIDWLVDEGIAAGFGDGTFRPEDSVTRQATAAFLERLLNV